MLLCLGSWRLLASLPNLGLLVYQPRCSSGSLLRARSCVRGCLAWMHGRAASRPYGFVVLGSCSSFWGRIFEYGKPRSSHPRLPSSHQPTQMHGRPHPHNRTPTTRSTTADANQRTTCLVRVSISTPLCCVLPLRASIVDHRARPPRLLFGLALWRARGTRAATIWWSSVRKERVSL